MNKELIKFFSERIPVFEKANLKHAIDYYLTSTKNKLSSFKYKSLVEMQIRLRQDLTTEEINEQIKRFNKIYLQYWRNWLRKRQKPHTNNSG